MASGVGTAAGFLCRNSCIRSSTSRLVHTPLRSKSSTKAAIPMDWRAPALRRADFLANAICRVKEESRRATVMDTRDQRGDLPQISRHPGLGIVLSGCFTSFLRLEKAQELAGLTLLFGAQCWVYNTQL